MLDVETLEVFYEYWYRKKYRTGEKYKFYRTSTTFSVCESFLKIIDKKYSLHSVGVNFLREYFLFQFNYWHELTLGNKFTDKITIAFIVGKKAFARWEKRDKEYDWQIETYPIVKLYGVHKNDLFMVREQDKKVNRFDSSRALRKQFHNTDRGFATCVEFTTLYDNKDTSCITCKFKKDCKELLRSNYPGLYKERGLIKS